MIGQIVTELSNFFLNPVGLLGLAAIIPLILFYLVKPKPKEEIMPSLVFFMKNRKDGKIQRAISTFLRNLLLLFHILFIAGIAAAMAQPFINDFGRPDNTVVVFDASASMSNDMDAARSFVKSNLGESNTLIVVTDQTTVPMEKASPAAVMNYINKLEPKASGTDISQGLEVAQDYEGELIIASDMDQTTDSRNAGSKLEEMSVNRRVALFNPENSNSWGVVSVNARRGNSTIEVKNYEDTTETVTVKNSGDSRKIDLKAGEVQQVTVSVDTGKNVVELESDGFDIDNRAYIYIPEEKEYKVTFVRDEPNPYFEKAVELIEFTTLNTVTPPDEPEYNADIYVIGSTSKILTESIRRMEADVHDGGAMAVMASDNVFNLKFNSLGVKKAGERKQMDVEFLAPSRTNIGSTKVYPLKGNNGKKLSEPKDALALSSHGRGNVFFYNIDDSDFHFDLMYPVFWKNTFNRLVDRPTIDDLNLKTGGEINESSITTPDGETKNGAFRAYTPGFYSSDSSIYAVNFLNQDEGYSERQDLDVGDTGNLKTRKNVQNLFAMVLAFLAFGELGYLRWRGDL